LSDDTHAAVEWILQQPSVDKDRIALIAGSTGSYPAFVCGAADSRVRAIVGISPVIVPQAFAFPQDMADHFATMVNGVTGQDLQKQWNALLPLADSINTFAPRPLLLVAADKDDIFPPSDYAGSIAGFPNIQLIRNGEADHGFSACRPWLVQTVTDWLIARLGT
jgi:cephalosporin-C deacetylase-like acetyl esterase